MVLKSKILALLVFSLVNSFFLGLVMNTPSSRSRDAQPARRLSPLRRKNVEEQPGKLRAPKHAANRAWTSEQIYQNAIDPAFPNPRFLDEHGKAIFQPISDEDPMYSSFSQNWQFPLQGCGMCGKRRTLGHFKRHELSRARREDDKNDARKGWAPIPKITPFPELDRDELASIEPPVFRYIRCGPCDQLFAAAAVKFIGRNLPPSADSVVSGGSGEVDVSPAEHVLRPTRGQLPRPGSAPARRAEAGKEGGRKAGSSSAYSSAYPPRWVESLRMPALTGNAPRPKSSLQQGTGQGRILVASTSLAAKLLGPE